MTRLTITAQADEARDLQPLLDAVAILLGQQILADRQARLLVVVDGDLDGELVVTVEPREMQP